VLDRYRILKAMADSGEREFTVRDLARMSGAQIGTVRTYVNREGHLLEEVGRDETGRRGGRFARYRVKPSEIVGLRARLEAVYSELGVAAPLVNVTEDVVEVPSGLLTAKEIFERRYPQAGEEQKRHLLEMVSIDLKGAREEIRALRRRGASIGVVTSFDSLLLALEHQLELESKTLGLGERKPKAAAAHAGAGWLSKIAENCFSVAGLSPKQPIASIGLSESGVPQPGERATRLPAGANVPAASGGITLDTPGISDRGAEGQSRGLRSHDSAEIPAPAALVIRRVEEIKTMPSTSVQASEPEKAAKEFLTLFPDPGHWDERDDVRARIAESAAVATYVFLRPADLAALGDDPAVYFPGVLSPVPGGCVLNVRLFLARVQQRMTQHRVPGRIGAQVLSTAGQQASRLYGIRTPSLLMPPKSKPLTRLQRGSHSRV